MLSASSPADEADKILDIVIMKKKPVPAKTTPRQLPAEIRVSGRVDDIDEDRDAALALEVIRVHHTIRVRGVERILSMVDGVALVVDATEGPMTQTRFVLSKALARAPYRPGIVLNKSDRPISRIPQVEAVTDVADIPSQNADAPQSHQGMRPLFDINREWWGSSICPWFAALIIGADPYSTWGKKVGDGRVKKLYVRVGMDRVERDEAGAGKIISIAGIKGGGVNVTLLSTDEKTWPDGVPQPLPSTPIDPPTISFVIMANLGPLGGTEGTKLTSQMIKGRIHREALTDVALAVLPGPTSDSLEGLAADSYEVDWWSFGTMLYGIGWQTPSRANNHSDMYVRVLQDELQFSHDRPGYEEPRSCSNATPPSRSANSHKEASVFLDGRLVVHAAPSTPIDLSNASDTQNFDDTFLDVEPALDVADDLDADGDADQGPATDQEAGTEDDEANMTPSQSRSLSIHPPASSSKSSAEGEGEAKARRRIEWMRRMRM
ncbi:hypothetical protein C8R46DRAFT_1205390 [Mycena filopes]|nr:hypothetical protein C8R46DRAFT_1205390 [Mycena filopes]